MTLDMCKDCKAFAPTGDENGQGMDIGACVRHPPTPLAIPVLNEDGQPIVDFAYIRPMTVENGTCCDYVEVSRIVPANGRDGDVTGDGFMPTPKRRR